MSALGLVLFQISLSFDIFHLLEKGKTSLEEASSIKRPRRKFGCRNPSHRKIKVSAAENQKLLKILSVVRI